MASFSYGKHETSSTVDICNGNKVIVRVLSYCLLWLCEHWRHFTALVCISMIELNGTSSPVSRSAMIRDASQGISILGVSFLHENIWRSSTQSFTTAAIFQPDEAQLSDPSIFFIVSRREKWRLVHIGHLPA
eukprot:scaffold1646_cov115-Amphora_coffeaeformis.AAC.2